MWKLCPRPIYQYIIYIPLKPFSKIEFRSVGILWKDLLFWFHHRFREYCCSCYPQNCQKNHLLRAMPRERRKKNLAYSSNYYLNFDCSNPEPCWSSGKAEVDVVLAKMETDLSVFQIFEHSLQDKKTCWLVVLVNSMEHLPLSVVPWVHLHLVSSCR